MIYIRRGNRVRSLADAIIIRPNIAITQTEYISFRSIGCWEDTGSLHRFLQIQISFPEIVISIHSIILHGKGSFLLLQINCLLKNNVIETYRKDLFSNRWRIIALAAFLKLFELLDQ